MCGMSMCDAGYSGQTIKIVEELREEFDLARSSCMDPLRLTVHKIYSQHAPTKLPRVDGILAKHEGHGQLLLCALIWKYNLSLVSVVVSARREIFGCPDWHGTPSLPLILQLSRLERVNKRILSRLDQQQ